MAGFGVPSDTFARYHRLRGNDVLMVSGTDEHGTPVMVAADAAGESPRETAERFSGLIREDLRDLGLSYDLFTRTTTTNHYRVTQDLFRTLYEKGYIVEQETLGAFSASTGHTLPDRYIEGTCPICGFESARGDQCDNCGNQLDPDGPDRPALEDRRRAAGLREDEAPVPRPAGVQGAADRLDRVQDDWRQNVRRFSLNFVKELKPRPITRDLDWGVPIPVAGVRGPGRQADLRLVRRGHRLPLGLDRVGREPRHRPTRGASGGRTPTAEHAYFMGKDNIVFHTVIWPSTLLGYEDRRRVRRGPRRARAPRQHRVERVPDHGGRSSARAAAS